MKTDAAHCEAPRTCRRTTLCHECRWNAYFAARYGIEPVPVKSEARVEWERLSVTAFQFTPKAGEGAR